MIVSVIIIAKSWKTELKWTLSNPGKVLHRTFKLAPKLNSIYMQISCLTTVILGVVSLSTQTHQDIPEKKKKLEN